MRKTVSFKLFFTVLWRGVCQMARFVGRLLGCNGEDSFAKVIWRIFVGCGAALMVMFTSMILYGFVTEFLMGECADWFRTQRSERVAHEMHISNFIVLQEFGYGGAASTRLYDVQTGRALMEGLDWVVVSEDKDSLAVFSKDGKRGYVNRFTGEVAIAPVYTRAWVFSEGLAAVEHNGVLKFIDYNGQVQIDRNFQVHFSDPAYAFHNGYCIMRDKVTGKFGFIDRSGSWAMEPEFDYVYPVGDFVYVRADYKEGLYSSRMEEIFSPEYAEVTVNEIQKTIFVRKNDCTAKIYDYEGNVVQDYVVFAVKPLIYETGKVEMHLGDNGEEIPVQVYATANCSSYKVGEKYYGYYGLMDKMGRRITPAIYTSIEAIAPNRYLCLPHGVILNDKGECVG